MMGDDPDPRQGCRRALKLVAGGKRYLIYESTEVRDNVETKAPLVYVRPRDDESAAGRAQRGLDVIERIEDDEGLLFTSLADGEELVLYMFRKVN